MSEIYLESIKTKVTVKRLRVKDYIDVLEVLGDFFSKNPSLMNDLGSGDNGRVLTTMLVLITQAYKKVKKVISIVATPEFDVDKLELEEAIDLLMFIYNETDILNKFESVKKKMGRVNLKRKK